MGLPHECASGRPPGGQRGELAIGIGQPRVEPDRVAELRDPLGHAIRFDSRLSDADRELATLAAGRATGCAFVWESHLGSARAAGVDAETIVALEAGSRRLPARAADIVAFVRGVCGPEPVSDETFRAAHDRLGDDAMVELALTVGYYSMLALTMRAFRAC
jgi:AhpD family alkylhydroperoxidase